MMREDRMNMRLARLTMLQRYAAFILWGFVQGAIAYFTLAFLMQGGGNTRDVAPWGLCLLSGGMSGALVFGFLLKAPRWLHSCGFLIVGILIPFIAATINWWLYNQTLGIARDPLAIVFIFIWTVYALPAVLFVTVAHFFAGLITKTNRDKAHSTAGTT